MACHREDASSEVQVQQLSLANPAKQNTDLFAQIPPHSSRTLVGVISRDPRAIAGLGDKTKGHTMSSRCLGDVHDPPQGRGFSMPRVQEPSSNHSIVCENPCPLRFYKFRFLVYQEQQE